MEGDLEAPGSCELAAVLLAGTSSACIFRNIFFNAEISSGCVSDFHQFGSSEKQKGEADNPSCICCTIGTVHDVVYPGLLDKLMKTLIVIPAHNEQAKIAEVIRDLHNYGYKNILVVNDGSNDRTAEIARNLGTKVASHIINRGLGAALGTGFEFARRNGFDCLVTFDGDGQHRAADLQRLTDPIKRSSADVVIGSRMLKPKGMPLGRLFVNHVSNLATFILYHIWTSDTLSGLRAFNRKAINTIDIKTDRMEVSNEFFFEIKKRGLRLKEVPIEPVYTEYSEKHSHNGVSLWQSVSNGKGMLLRLFR